jgi:hypothetical protein
MMISTLKRVEELKRNSIDGIERLPDVVVSSDLLLSLIPVGALIHSMLTCR